jgi:hypothetical protein
VLPTKPQTPVIMIFMVAPPSGSLLPRLPDFLEDPVQADTNLPLRVMCPQLAQITVVADMVTNSIVVHVSVSLRLPGQLFDQRKGLKH